jgi:acid phosphatase
LGNDDEFEETMEPFITKIKKLQKKGGKRGKKGKKEGVLPKKGDWAFLRSWESPIVEDNLEKLSERGRTDAEVGSFSELDIIVLG